MEQTLIAGVPKTITHAVSLNPGLGAGEYDIRVGVFEPGWAELLHWNNNAGTLQLVEPETTVTLTPSPTSGITPQPPSPTAVPAQSPVPTDVPVLSDIPAEVTPTPTPTDQIRVPQETTTPSSTGIPTQGISTAPIATITIIADPENCPRKPEGDANCDNEITLIDHEIFRSEYLGEWDSRFADFNSDGNVSLLDVEIWVRSFLK